MHSAPAEAPTIGGDVQLTVSAVDIRDADQLSSERVLPVPAASFLFGFIGNVFFP